ncbi:MAG: DUF4203 domain-containing protein [Planctomycetes bacterium]|nr:DUF4203 domain-containing protein [Planctomycetota bacterium]
MLERVSTLLERLNLSQHRAIAGEHFPEILALLSIVFGGAFLLYGWKHHEYFLGMTGFLVGGWAGMIAKAHFAPAGGVPPFLYLGACAVGGAYVAVHFRQLMGILLGGFTVAVLGSVFLPNLFSPGNYSSLTVAMAFLIGGGLGAIFPKFFFIFNSSLIGSVFVTYGVSAALVSRVAGDLPPRARLVVHLLVFLPLLIFGVLYQLTASREEAPAGAPVPAPVPARHPA